MSGTEKRVLETFARIVPKLPKEGQERLLAIGEGIGIGAGVMKIEECSFASREKEDIPGDREARPA